MSPTLLDSLGIKYDNGFYLTRLGDAKFVLVTGWRKEEIYNEDGRKVLENMTGITPRILQRCGEAIVELHKVRDDPDSVRDIFEESGFVVFSQKDGYYACYFPSQEIDYREVRKRFAFPPEEPRVARTLDSFVVPYTYLDGIIRIDPPSGSRENDLKLDIWVSRNYFYSVMHRVIELGGYGQGYEMKDKMMEGNMLRFMIPPNRVKQLKEGLNIDGVLAYYYASKDGSVSSGMIHNKAWRKKEKQIEAIECGEHIKLSALPSEIKRSKKGNVFYIPIKRRPEQIVEELREETAR